ncbi:Cold-shock DNA-binding domain-containing protein [Ditylenchus destructor]|nr:Cold-shock DNA-binding domain-containing protein [Ditylenchus destructor]
MAGESSVKNNPQNDAKKSRVLVERGILGKVSWFSVHRGFGFIDRDDTGERVFVHITSIMRNSRFNQALDEGDKVAFDVIQGHKGVEAVLVTSPEGTVAGYRFVDPTMVVRRRGPPRTRRSPRRPTPKKDKEPEKEIKGINDKANSELGESDTDEGESGSSESETTVSDEKRSLTDAPQAKDSDKAAEQAENNSKDLNIEAEQQQKVENKAKPTVAKESSSA